MTALSAEKAPLALVLIGLGCVALALGLKAVSPGPKARLALARCESAEIGDDMIVVLKDFRVRKYPSGKPCQYESEVHVIGRNPPSAMSATVSVNRPLRWNGWWFHQLACDGDCTELEVSRDPFLPLAAAGGVFLALGALWGLAAWRKDPVAVRGGQGGRRRIWLSAAGAAIVFAVPLVIVLRAVTRPEPPPSLQSPLMIPHVASYAASYLIMIFAAFGLCRRLLPAGFLLMTAGLVLGAVWGKVCWGDFWQYDPKEMWSLAVYLVYVAYFGCRGRPRAELALRILGAALVVLTSTWVNFSRLFAGLHSYS